MMKPMTIAGYICVFFLIMIFVLPWIILGVFMLLAGLGIIELEPVTIQILWNVINS